MLWWNQHLWLEYKLIKPAPPWTWAKGTSLLLWRTSFWPWSHTDLPSWGRFCEVKTPGSHRAQAPCLLDHTSYLGPYTSLWKWPSAHVRNFTGLFPVCFPTGRLCYWCVYLWPGGVANWGWLQGYGGSPRLRCSQGSTRGSEFFLFLTFILILLVLLEDIILSEKWWLFPVAESALGQLSCLALACLGPIFLELLLLKLHLGFQQEPLPAQSLMWLPVGCIPFLEEL